VKELTIAQLRGIYTGAITNWKQIGGKDAAINSNRARTPPEPTLLQGHFWRQGFTPAGADAAGHARRGGSDR
jgi:hypothetical protein